MVTFTFFLKMACNIDSQSQTVKVKFQVQKLKNFHSDIFILIYSTEVCFFAGGVVLMDCAVNIVQRGAFQTLTLARGGCRENRTAR